VALCQHVADAITRELQAPALTIEWVRVSPEERFRAAEQGTIDLLCGADSVTLDRRRQVAFSTPVFPGGIGAMVRADAPAALQDVLSGKGQTYRPTRRASATQILQAIAFSAVSGTTAETWLAKRINELQVVTTIVPSSTYDDGIAALRNRQVSALFGERAILLNAARRNASARDLVVLDRLFTYEPLALAMRANDERFRLIVDRTLARLHASGEFVRLYTKWFGEPDESTLQFFRWNTLSE
jgi:ABC-type amino acid transport substrate-binding protein